MKNILTTLAVALATSVSFAQWGGGSGGGWVTLGTGGGASGGIGAGAGGFFGSGASEVHGAAGMASASFLPIELIEFTAKVDGEGHVRLNWTTSTEINNDFFTIEKSQDGTSFSGVINVKGAGNSSSNLNYTATDFSPFRGTSYYRLKQTDFDGKFSYSKLEPVFINSPGNLVISKNGVSGNYTVDFKSLGETFGDYTIEFTNSIGQTVYKETLNNFSGNYTRDFDFLSAGKGVYLVSVTGSSDKIIKRVVAY